MIRIILLILSALLCGCSATLEWQTPQGALAVSYRSPEGYSK